MQTREMEYRPLGRCGTQVSVLSLGGWITFGGTVADAQMVRRLLHKAFDAGVNFFDMADAYAEGNAERVMGQVLRDFPRHRLVLSSKVFFPMSDDVNDRGLSRKHIMESVEKSLGRLGTDYLDLYFCHRFDENTPLEETARAMDDLIHQGKILYWGTSEWTGTQLAEVYELCRENNLYRPQVEQPQYNLLARAKFEQDVRPVLDAQGMGAVIWSPLAAGMLTGKYDEGFPPNSRFGRIKWIREWMYSEQRRDRVRAFKAHADALGCTRARLAIAWAARRPGVSSVITGVTRPDQLDDNLGALTVEFDDDVRRKLDELFPAGGPNDK